MLVWWRWCGGAGLVVTYTHETRSLVHDDRLSTSDITGTHGIRSLVHMDGGAWGLLFRFWGWGKGISQLDMGGAGTGGFRGEAWGLP